MPEWTIVVLHNDEHYRVSIHDLALALGIDPSVLRSQFRALVCRAKQLTNVSERIPTPTTLRNDQRSERIEKNNVETINETLDQHPAAKLSTEGGAVDRLCALLGDRERGAITALVQSYSQNLIEQALAVTLRVPDHRIQKNRGAYFTAVLKAMARAEGSGSP